MTLLGSENMATGLILRTRFGNNERAGRINISEDSFLRARKAENGALIQSKGVIVV
jgi:hypothetical protein